MTSSSSSQSSVHSSVGVIVVQAYGSEYVETCKDKRHLLLVPKYTGGGDPSASTDREEIYEPCLVYARKMREFILSSGTKYAEELRTYKHTDRKYRPVFQMDFHFYTGEERRQSEYSRVMRIDLAQDPLVLCAFICSSTQRYSLVPVAIVQEKKNE